MPSSWSAKRRAADGNRQGNAQCQYQIRLEKYSGVNRVIDARYVGSG
jgi:hypothetical protein